MSRYKNFLSVPCIKRFSSVFGDAHALIVLAPVMAFLCISNGLRGLAHFFRRAFSNSLQEKDVSTINQAVSLGFILGCVGWVLGMIHVMENLSDPSRLGSGVAVAFISIIYGALPALFLIPFCPPDNYPKKLMNKSGAYTAVASFAVLISLFTILYGVSNH